MDKKKLAATLAIITGLSVGGVELKQNEQLSNIKNGQYVDVAMTVGLMSLSESYDSEIKKLIIEDFEEDGAFDPNNLNLYKAILSKELDEIGRQYMRFEPENFNNEEKKEQFNQLIIND